MEPAMEPQENGESPFRFSPNRPTLANTRVLDNHYDPRVHEKPWIASGHLKDYKYEYSDSGLGYMMKKPHKMRNFKERHEQVQEIDDINKRNKGFRHFREYENVVNNEILITIEYCTNCKEHQGSTRHDEAKYATYANTLKREIITHYPIVKVVLKPLIFEQNDQATETLYLRSRIGAFEVQLFSKNSKGQINKQYIFSKLYSKNWPSISRVVEDVSKFLPTDDFVVRLIDPNYDPEETKQSESKLGYSQSKGQANKIKGLHVILRPLRTQKKAPNTLTELSTSSKVMNESSRFGPGGTSRPNSAAVRPQSAYSTTSSKSMLSNKKALKERDENFSATGTATQNNLAPPKEYVGQSDDFGIVLFKQIPHNMYEVELLETQNYLPDKKIVNIFDMVENNQMLREDIILQEQTMGFCRIKITDGGMPFGDASIIIAKKFPDKNSKTAVLREKDVGRGVFEFMIDPGEYVLSINKMGFGERKEEIIAVRGVNEFAFDMRQPPSYTQHPSHNEERVYERPISASRPEERPSSRQRPTSSKGRPPSSHGRPTSSNGRPDAAKLSSKGNLDVIQQENMEASPVKKGQKANTNEDIEEERGTKQKNERVKSALVKKVEFSIYDVDSERPVSGVQVILEEIGFRGITTEHGKCLVPINKLTQGKLILNHDAFFGMVEEYGGEDGIDLKNATEKKFYLISKPSDNNEVQLRFLPGRGIQCCQFSVLYNKEDDSNKKDVVVQHADGGKEIIILKNLLKKHGVFRIIAEIYDLNEFFHPESTFILSHYADCDPLYIFPPSESDLQGSRLIWDVGFFADPVTNPQFIEINGYSSTEITLYSYLREYQMLLNYLQNSKSDLKTLLGFKEKNRIEKDDDVFIPKETIYASLDKYGLEIKNVDHLLSSARGSDGLYSLRECERRFASLRPPFNFVKDQKGDSSSDNNYGSEEGEEEEYLYEDDN